MKTKIFSRVFKYLQILLLFFITAVALYLLTATVFSLLKTRPQKIECDSITKIFIVSNGVHIDIIVPIEKINLQFKNNLEVIDNTKFIAFGWGDKAFYLNTPEWSDLTFRIAFKALFLKSETAMHVTNYRNSRTTWRSVNLCDEQLELLLLYIKNSFQINEDGTIQRIPVQGYSDYDAFFEARGNFSLFYTCNVWINQALKEAGIKTSIWSPFDKGILFHINKNYN